ncbi:MAG: peptidyl-prolyl cis-trans isomerase [Prolixibacteraceae bacterium]|nr:peptidyl-prolyl cis-trans isomerase [Prolixibacteraceae bacterium]
MFRKNNSIICAAIVLLFLWGCKQQAPGTKDIVVAEAAGKQLYKSDIIHNPIGYADTTDSIEFVNEFIINWIKNQLLVAEAEARLSNEKRDIERELEKYRQELLIHKYRNIRIGQDSNNEISNAELEKFYSENMHLFKLDRSIVRITYMIFPTELELPANFKEKIKGASPDELAGIEDFIYSFATKYDHFDNNWLYLENFLQSINYQSPIAGQTIKENDIIEFISENNHHFIVVNNYIAAGNTAPFDFVAPRIRNLILNRKKLDFLREIKDSLYNNALKYNKFRVFNQ